MADFCNICTSQLFSVTEESENVGDIISSYRALQGGDFNIIELFKEHIQDKMDEFLSSENYCLNIAGICEHCGLMRLSVLKENDITYLVAWCWKDSKENNTGKYKIAVIKDDGELDIEPQIDEITKYFEE